MFSDTTILLILVFITVFLLSVSLSAPVFGIQASRAKRARARVRRLTAETRQTQTLLRERRLKELSPLEQTLEGLPLMDALARLLEQAGLHIPAYRFALLCVGFGGGGAFAVHVLSDSLVIASGCAFGLAALPVMELRRRQAKRLALFEQQLPEALDMLSRALRAGMPFTEALKITGSEMPDPVGVEIRTTFTDINYGIGMREGLLNLSARIPSISLSAVVTAVLVQRETGGNLAEILDKIAAVVRSRFRLQRRVRTLSAEGRMSAWVLALVPFLLAGVLSVTSPDYLPRMLDDPLGPPMLLTAFVGMVVGMLWIRKVIRIRV